MAYARGNWIGRQMAIVAIAAAVSAGEPAIAAPASQETFAPLSLQDHHFAFVDVASIRRRDDTTEVSILSLGPSYEDEAGYRGYLSRYSVDCHWGMATLLSETVYLNGAPPRSEAPSFRGPVFYWSDSPVGQAAGLACAPNSQPLPAPTVSLASALDLAKEKFPLSAPSPVPAVPPMAARPASEASAPAPWGPRLGWTPELLLVLRDGERAVFVDRSQIVRREGVVQLTSLWVADAGRKGNAPSYALRGLILSCSTDDASITRDINWRYESSRTSKIGASGMMSIAASRPLAALRKAVCGELPPGTTWKSLREAVDALTPGS